MDLTLGLHKTLTLDFVAWGDAFGIGIENSFSQDRWIISWTATVREFLMKNWQVDMAIDQPIPAIQRC